MHFRVESGVAGVVHRKWTGDRVRRVSDRDVDQAVTVLAVAGRNPDRQS